MVRDLQAQTLTDKKYQYFGSARTFYSGITLGSTEAFQTVLWSGIGGFGADQNHLSQRLAIVSSGISVFEWSFDGGTTLAGAADGGEAFTFDGINRSGIDLRANAAGQVLRIFVW